MQMYTTAQLHIYICAYICFYVPVCVCAFVYPAQESMPAFVHACARMFVIYNNGLPCRRFLFGRVFVRVILL